MNLRTLERSPAVDVDPRIAARRDAVTADRRRRRHRLLAWFVAVVTVVAGGWFLTRTALLDVETVEVEGVTNTSADAVRTASGIVPGDPLVGLDEGRAVRGIEALPWVADATVERSIDGTVRVRVVERSAVATVPSEGGRSLVDAEGRVLAVVAPDAPAGDGTSLMAIEGLQAPEPGSTLGPLADGALELVAGLDPGLRSRVRTVTVTSQGELQLSLVPDIVVEVGAPTGLDDKLGRLVTFLSQVDQTGLAVIDLRVPELVTSTRRG